MTPTNEVLNRAMAEATGWIPAVYKHGGEWYYVRPEEVGHGWTPKRDDATPMSVDAARYPDFCRDRNALPEILDAVEAAGRQWSMATRLDKDLGKGVVESAWIMWRLPMRELVEAALRALGAWRREWDGESADGRPVLPLVVKGRGKCE